MIENIGRESIQGGFPVITPISHPVLRRLGIEDIRRFVKDRGAYVSAIKERCQQEGSEELQKPVSLRFSIDPDILENLVEIGSLGEQVTSIDDVTDENIQAWLSDHVESDRDSLSKAQIDQMVSKKIRINMKEKSAAQRILMLLSDYMSFLRNNGLSWIIKEKPTVAIGHVCDALRPISLQKRVQDDVSFSHSALEKNWKGFVDHLIRRAQEFEKFDIHIYDSVKFHGTARPSSPIGTKHEKISENSNNTRILPTPRKKELPSCLNPDCEEKHLLKHCKNTSKELKKELYNKLAEQRKIRGEQRSTRRDFQQIKAVKMESSKNSNTQQGNSESGGRLHATFGEGLVTAVLLPDIGSDDNVLPQSLVSTLEKKGLFVPSRQLAEPLKVNLAIKSPGRRVTIRKQVQLGVEIKLPVGPLRLRNVSWLVSEGEMDEILLGRPLLKSMGLDATMHLSEVRDTYQDLDCSTSKLPSGSSYLSKLLVKSVREDKGPVKSKITEKDEEDSPSLEYNTKEISIDNATTTIYGEPEPENVENPSLLSLPSPSRDENRKEAVEGMLRAAQNEGLCGSGMDNLSELVREFKDIWRISLDGGPPAKLPPMEIKLKKDPKHFRSKVRKYPHEQREFLKSFVDELIANGHAYRNPNSSWCCAALVVPKPGPEKFRFTVDLRPVNKETLPKAWPMPHLDVEMSKLAGSSIYATFDLSSGYWQLELKDSSQECQSFITPDGVFTPTRVLHGTTNAVVHLQSAMQGVLLSQPQLAESLLVWLDDCLLYSKTEEEHLKYLRMFFQLCRDYNLKLNPLKCRLFAKEINWCGRVLSSTGIRFDPRRIQGLKDMKEPSNGSDLQQFVCALNWMRTCIPEFSKLIAPLQNILEEVYKVQKGKRTKKAAAKVILSDVGWGNEHNDSFRKCQNALENAVTLAYPSPEKRFCLYSDASEKFWSSVVTQVPYDDLNLPHSQQRHEPLSFFSGRFTGAMKRWAIVEKEAYAIVITTDKMSWLLKSQNGFALFTYHNNLTYMFNPYRANPNISSHSAAKLVRWALKLSCFTYVIEHIPGEDNVWPDLLTRWAAPKRVARSSALMLSPLSPHIQDSFVWPGAQDIRESQEKALKLKGEEHKRDFRLHLKNGLYKNEEGKVWIPSDDLDLQLRICVISHAGIGGHRGYEATLSAIQDHFFWRSLNSDIDVFCRTCLHCKATLGGKTEPRPLGEALHASAPNEVIHFDFLYMGPSESEYVYILIVKDDLSGYVWLTPCESCDSHTVADVLLNWFSAFGISHVWVSDQGSHFKNTVMTALRKSLAIKHHFTTAYTPWANGTVERVCREVLRAARALLSEFRMRRKQWPSVVKIIQSVLNNSPSKHRGNIAPLTGFTGRKPDRPLASILKDHTSTVHSMEFIRAQQLINTELLGKAIDRIHKRVKDNAEKGRHAARQRHSRKTGVENCNFDVGDYVLVSRRDADHVDKLCVRWSGPRRIRRVLTQKLFEVEDLRNGSVETIHATRIRFYHDSSLNVSEELIAHIAHNEQGYEVEDIKEIRYSRKEKNFEVRVHWKGFESPQDDTWEELKKMREDVPDIVSRFLQKRKGSSVVRRALSELN